MSNPSQPGKTQRDRSIEAARELGADEDEATLKAKLAVIALQKPKDAPEVQQVKPNRKGGE